MQSAQTDIAEPDRQAPSHIVVGVIGPSMHDTGTLAEAILTRQAQRGEIVDARPEDLMGQLWPHWREYRTAQRAVALVDCPSNRVSLSDVARAAAAMDGAILVVPVGADVETRLRDTVLLLRQAGVRHLIVYLHGGESDRIDEAEVDVRRVLIDWHFPGDDVPVVRGSSLALNALSDPDAADWRSVDELIAIIEWAIPRTRCEEEGPLMLPVGVGHSVYGGDDAFHIALGRVEQGRIRLGEKVEVYGIELQSFTLPVHELTCFNRPIQSATTGASIRVVLRGGAKNWHIRVHQAGQVIATPGTLRASHRLKVRLTLLPGQDKRARPVPSGFRPSFLIHTARLRGRIELPAGVRQMHRGETHSVQVELSCPVVAAVSQTVACRDSSGTVGYGVIEGLS